MRLQVTYEGADVLICDGYSPKGNDYTDVSEIISTRAVIACNKAAEDLLYNWNVRFFTQTGIEIGTLRTVFGLTFYASCSKGKTAINDFLKESRLTLYYGHL